MKKVKTITITLAIILVTLVAFAGVYVKTQNRMENKIRGYDLSRELEGGRVIELKIPTSDEKNDSKEIAIEDYEIVKKTIEERLNNFGAQDYTISLNKEDGTIRVELPEDNNTDIYVYLLTASVEVLIKEKDANTELLNDSMIKNATYTYTANTEGSYQVYLDLHLTKEGQAKIEEIKNNYAVLEDEIEEIEASQKDDEEGETTEKDSATEEEKNNEATINENEENVKKIAVLTIGGTEYNIEKIEKNKITIKMGNQTTSSSTVTTNMNAAAELAILISSGKYPVEYEIKENKFIYSDITKEQMILGEIAVAVVMLIVLIIFIIKYRTNGFLASISYIGFVAILSLLLRYTNVNISIEGIGAILVILIINIRMNQIILSKNKNMQDASIAVTDTYKEVFLKLIPIVIITLVFCFSGWSNLSSCGMIMFWGLVLIAVYNVIVTKTLLKLKESK